MKLLHVTIQTDKFEQELGFYQTIIGLRMIRDMRSLGRNLVFLADGEGDTEIEIIENADAKNAGNENLSIGFKTQDVDEMRAQLTAEGFEATPMISPAPQVKFFFVKDPAGVSVQFM